MTDDKLKTEQDNDIILDMEIMLGRTREEIIEYLNNYYDLPSPIFAASRKGKNILIKQFFVAFLYKYYVPKYKLYYLNRRKFTRISYIAIFVNRDNATIHNTISVFNNNYKYTKKYKERYLQFEIDFKEFLRIGNEMIEQSVPNEFHNLYNLHKFLKEKYNLPLNTAQLKTIQQYCQTVDLEAK